jgi:hypothetical protein
MSSFLRKLSGIFRPAKTARPARRTGRRTDLRLEHLEERMVPTGIVTNGTFLNVACSPGRLITFAQSPINSNEMVISDNVQGTVATVSRSAFKTVVVDVAGQDSVNVDDSNGMPFLLGQTIDFDGNGTSNFVNLFGSRPIDTGASYSAGATAGTASKLVEDNLTFNVSNVITQVTDTLQDTGGALTVATSGNGVILTSSGSQQSLTNLGPGGGGTFTFANKSQVVLNENAAFSQVFLESRADTAANPSFTLQMNAQNDVASVFATPFGCVTNIQAAGNDQTVNVQSTSGALNIGGGSTTDVNLAGAGIQASVSVTDVADLVVTNTGSAAQDVTVTNAAIFGTGLFGNNSAEVSFQFVKLLAINAGSGADHYTVNALSGPMTSQLEIEDTSKTTSFVDNVFVNSGSLLNLDVVNLADPSVGQLIVHHNGGKAGISKVSPTSTNGVVKVSYPGEPPSEVTFDGFAVVKTESF